MRVLMINPGNDPTFVRLAEDLVAHGVTSAGDLESRLREQYPQAAVRVRSLEGDEATWYVYREGRWSTDGLARRIVRPRQGPPLL
ncbi:MAG: hypothetical protein ABI628_04635 [Chloroflexota bacterium]